MRDTPEVIESWKGQVEGLRLYSSYQDAVGIDGEAIEFEWKNFPGFSSLSILQKIQQDLERRNIQPKEFKDRVIFMSIFNDIDWTTNDENCFSNAEKVKNYAMRFSQGHGTFFGPGWEEKWYGSSFHAQKRAMELYSRQNGATIQRNWSSCVSKYQCFESWNLAKKKGYETIHFHGDSMNTELVPNNSFCNSAQYLQSSSELCYQFG